MADARRSERVPAQGVVWLTAKGFGVSQTRVLDTSSGGVRLQGVLGLREQTSVTLIFDAGSPSSYFRRAVVRWVNADTLGVEYITAMREG